MQAITRANNPIASDSANPSIAYANNWFFNFGLFEYDRNKAPKTTPIPTPAPINPEHAAPAPTAFNPIKNKVPIQCLVLYSPKT